MKKSLTITFVLIAFVIVLFLSPGIVSRADGGDLSLVHACVKDKGGDVKIAGANSSCPSGYTPLHWGLTGPQGPQGAQGLQGPPGPATLPAAYYQTISPGLTNVQTNVPEFTTIGTFDLPPGKWALFVTVNTWLLSSNVNFTVSCQIPEIPGMSVAYAPGSAGSDYETRITLQMQNFSSLSASTQTLTLKCTLSDGWWTGFSFQTQGASLMAIQVAP